MTLLTLPHTSETHSEVVPRQSPYCVRSDYPIGLQGFFGR